MSSFSEEFKDQKINQMLEDYIALENEMKNSFAILIKAIEETPARFDGVISEKLNQLISDSLEIDKEIKEATTGIAEEKIKHITELKEDALKIKQKLSDDIIDLLDTLKRNQEKSQESLMKSQDKLQNVFNSHLDKMAKHAQPFSKKTAIAICAACTIFVTTGLSGAFWYVNNQSKMQMEEKLSFAATGFLDMQELAEKAIDQLPASKKTEFKKKFDSINSRTN
ncbi:hypothetical protein DCF83_18075 (plasmid) [Edwardsiella tarda]|uniref:hypothetical protein n=1 Tax=Edwardsiella tarda TaxID=636 RepID=UPI000D51B2D2|nr:hypothetical protein [Edwardsiella tarda]UCQ29627.1 hypothetical protein DCF83_18075 [Edwardsiella tarda]